mgnify:CR=1 FL=1
MYKIVGSIFLITGLLIWWFISPLGIEILLHFDRLIGLIALFFLLPLLNAVVKVGRYDQILSSIITTNTKNVYQLYQKTSLISYILSIFLNLAVIPVLFDSVKKNIQHLGEKFLVAFFSHSILRPYTLALLWSPTELLLAVTIDFTGQKYLTLLPILLSISIFVYFIDLLLHKIKYQKITLSGEKQQDSSFHPLFKRKIAEFMIAILLFICAASLLNQLLMQGFLFTLITLIFPFSFIWSLFVKKPKRFLKLGSLLIKNNETSISGIFFLFLSAGFFVEMIFYTSVFSQINTLLLNIYQQYSLFIFYLIIGLCFLVLALVGFHPMVSMSVLFPFLESFVSEVPLGIAVTVVCAAMSTSMFGPFNVTPSVLAVLIRKSPYHITKQNFLFSLCFITAGALIAFLLTVW